MNKILSLALLIGGIVLIVLGVNAADSVSSDISKFFTGTPTDKAVWMLVIGIICTIAGLGGTVFFPGRRH
jgi:divalent metal cation (Fe/Co/Zn/Cd) transporter